MTQLHNRSQANRVPKTAGQKRSMRIQTSPISRDGGGQALLPFTTLVFIEREGKN